MGAVEKNVAEAMDASEMTIQLEQHAEVIGCSLLDREFAVQMDERMPGLRSQFHYPKNSGLPKSKKIL